MPRNARFSLMFILWMALIGFLSLHYFPQRDLPHIRIPHFDKAVHTVFYFVAVVLGCLFIRERTRGRFGQGNALWAMGATVFLYGILIEVLQATIASGRQGDLYDVLANALGIALGMRALWVLFSPGGRLKWRQ